MIRSLFAAVLLLAPLSFAHADPFTSNAIEWLDEPEKPLHWGEWDRVALITLDAQEAGAGNQHPVRLQAQDIARRLALVRVERGQEALQALTGDEIGRLAPVVAAALTQARSDQDLLFLTSGNRRLFGAREANAGRIFFSEGQLNVIFGTVLSDILTSFKSSDRRSPPVEYGSRNHPPRGVMLATPRPNEGTLVRDNWIRFAIPFTPIAAPARPSGKPAESQAKPPRNENLRLKELERMHRSGLIDDAEFTKKRGEIQTQP